MRYYIIAGEPSGDLHGSNLMRALKSKDPSALFQYWGGDHMKAVSEGLLTHISETSIMGFVEVVKNLPKILSFFKKAKSTILDFQPDVLILIDYPGFNLRLAKWAHGKGIKVVYYISPQLWAWKKSRVHDVKKYVDEMITILPFEKEFYKTYDLNVHYVGHPLVEVLSEYKPKSDLKSQLDISKKIIALLPGSRKQEVEKLLPVYLTAIKNLSEEYEIVVAGSNHLDPTFYKEFTQGIETTFHLVFDQTYDLLKVADCSIVTSGTATLETALLKVPQVVCYKTSPINYAIGKRLVDLKYISLVNLISDKEVVPELIQNEANPENIEKALLQVIQSKDQIQEDYSQLEGILKSEGKASELAAEIIFKA